MKKNTSIAFYSAMSGIYYDRRLRRSTSFVVASYALVIGFMILAVGQGMRHNWGRPIAVHGAPSSSLVTHTLQAEMATPAVQLSSAVPAVQATANQLTTETNHVGDAVQIVIGKPPAATWSIAIYDLKTGSWVYRTNATAQMSAANLSELYTVYGLSKKLPFSAWSTTTVGSRNVQTCVDLMIRQSDSLCTQAITNFVGWKAIDSAVRSAGFSGTVLNLSSSQVTTAEDTTRFMAALYQGKLFDAATSGFLKTSLQKQLYRSAIPAGCKGCTTYNKAGNEKGVAHDTAIVVDGGRSYVVTIMSQGGNYYKISTVEQAIQANMTAVAKP
jgi:hypothetical protein